MISQLSTTQKNIFRDNSVLGDKLYVFFLWNQQNNVLFLLVRQKIISLFILRSTERNNPNNNKILSRDDVTLGDDSIFIILLFFFVDSCSQNMQSKINFRFFLQLFCQVWSSAQQLSNLNVSAKYRNWIRSKFVAWEQGSIYGIDLWKKRPEAENFALFFF